MKRRRLHGKRRIRRSPLRQGEAVATTSGLTPSEIQKVFTKLGTSKTASSTTKTIQATRSAVDMMGGSDVISQKIGSKYVKKGLENISKQAVKRGATTTVKLAKGLAAGLTGVAALSHMYDFWKGGQEQSGGRFGYKKNPNYKKDSKAPRHGDADSGAEFIPSGNLVKEHKESIWEKNRSSIWDKNKKGS